MIVDKLSVKRVQEAHGPQQLLLLELPACRATASLKMLRSSYKVKLLDIINSSGTFAGNTLRAVLDPNGLQ